MGNTSWPGPVSDSAGGNRWWSGVASRISLGIGALGSDSSGNLVGKPETIPTVYGVGLPLENLTNM
jgi:hypothetical protein